MSQPIINMTPIMREVQYCEGCQELGEEQVSGIKRHRNLPLDTWLVELTCEVFEKPREVVYCANCIDQASKEKFITLTEPDYYQPFKV